MEVVVYHKQLFMKIHTKTLTWVLKFGIYGDKKKQVTMQKYNFIFTSVFKTTFILCQILLFQACLGSIDTDLIFAGGSGTEKNPYRVSTVYHLQLIADANYLDKHFIQINDIDASSSKQFNNGRGFQPIGNKEAPFTGTYDGGGHDIYGLVLNYHEKHVGLFSFVKGGSIENVTVKNDLNQPDTNMDFQFSKKMDDLQVKIYPIANDDLFELSAFGFLVGVNEGGVIQNCTIESMVAYNFDSVGGLVGINTGVIENSIFYGGVSSLNLSAGLAAINTGRIMDSSSGGIVAGPSAAGLVGRNNGGEITRSFSIANVRSGFIAGGLVAYNTGRIVSSYSIGNELFDSSGIVGGLVARNNGEITNSYTTIEINVFFGQNRDIITGGLTGQNLEDGIISNSYASGKIHTPDGTVTGGLIGLNNGQVIFSYWDTQASGQNQGVGEGSADGATGLTTQQMSGPAAQQHMPEFDWNAVWRTTTGYPVLRWQGGE